MKYLGKKSWIPPQPCTHNWYINNDGTLKAMNAVWGG